MNKFINKNFETILGLAFASLLAFCAFLVSCNNKPQDMKNGEVEISRDKRQVSMAGATVYSNKGVSQAVLDAVDLGFAEMKRNATASYYVNQLNIGNYQFFIPSNGCEQSPQQRIWSFKVRADNYDGSEYDTYNPKGAGVKDGIGLIYAAEMITSFGVVGGSYIGMVICTQNAEQGSQYGSEHIAALYNDSVYFGLTQTHIQGDGHPILPQLTQRNPTRIEGLQFVYDDRQPIPHSKPSSDKVLSSTSILKDGLMTVVK